MSNIKQYNRPIRGKSTYGTIHPFKVIDVGDKNVMVNMGKFYSLGQNGGEVNIGGDLGEKMVDHLWNDHDSKKSFSVKQGDFIYLLITYADPENEDCCSVSQVSSVKLEKGSPPDTTGVTKVLKLAKITKQEKIPETEIWLTSIEQLWKSDAVDIFIGEDCPDGTTPSDSSGGGGGESACPYSEVVEMDVMVGITCDDTDESGSGVGESDTNQESSDCCCIYLTPIMTTIKFCGEKGAEFDGPTIVCCCDCEDSSSSGGSSEESSSSGSSENEPDPSSSESSSESCSSGTCFCLTEIEGPIQTTLCGCGDDMGPEAKFTDGRYRLYNDGVTGSPFWILQERVGNQFHRFASKTELPTEDPEGTYEPDEPTGNSWAIVSGGCSSSSSANPWEYLCIQKESDTLCITVGGFIENRYYTDTFNPENGEYGEGNYSITDDNHGGNPTDWFISRTEDEGPDTVLANQTDPRNRPTGEYTGVIEGDVYIVSAGECNCGDNDDSSSSSSMEASSSSG